MSSIDLTTEVYCKSKQTCITMDTRKARLTLTGVFVAMVSTISMDAMTFIDVCKNIKIKISLFFIILPKKH